MGANELVKGLLARLMGKFMRKPRDSHRPKAALN